MERMLDKWLKEGFHPVSGLDGLAFQPVIDVEGIGEVYSEELAAAGIKTLLDLWMGSAVQISNRTGIDPDLILRWQKMADLCRIDGVGVQYAELLVSAEIDTVEKLAGLEVADVQKRIEKALKKYPTMVGRKPGKKKIEAWIMNALTINLASAPEV